MKSKKENYDPVDFLLEIKIRWLWLILLVGAGVIYLMVHAQQTAIDNYEKSIYDVSAPAEGAWTYRRDAMGWFCRSSINRELNLI